MSKIKVQVKLLPNFTGLSLPKYETAGAAGLDVCAAIAAESVVRIWPGQRILIPTGMKVAVPDGYEIQVRSRSGLALRNGIVVANGVGTIDSDYRGELGIILLNTNPPNTGEVFEIKRGDRIAQIVLSEVSQLSWDTVDTLTDTKRGEGGFGSTNGLPGVGLG